jgi:tape measure domain-containing protein
MAETTVVRNIRIVGQTEGIGEAKAKLEQLGTAQGQVAVASEKSSRATLSMQQAVERLQRQTDLAYRVQQQFTSGTTTLNRAFEQGLISLQRRTELMQLLEQRTIGAARANDNFEASRRRRPFEGAGSAVVRGLEPSLQQIPGAGFASSLTGMSGGAMAIAGGVAGLAATAGAIAKMGDEWTTYSNRLKAAGEDQSVINRRLDDLAQIAMRSRTQLAPTIDLYSGISKSTQDLGKSQSDVARVTETISKAFSVGGQSASTAAGAILQLNQAFASGVLRGDEFNSVLEGAPPLARLIAQEFGIAMGDLRKFAEDGKLTADRVFDAFLKGSREIDTTFDSTTMTLSQASTNAVTALSQLGAQMDATLGISQSMARGLGVAASAINAMVGSIRDFQDQRKLGEIQNLSAVIDNLEKTDIPWLTSIGATKELKEKTADLARFREQYNALTKDRINGYIAPPAKIDLNAEGALTTPRAATTYTKAMSDMNDAAKKVARDGMDTLERATAEANDRFNDRAKVAAKMRTDGVESAKIAAYEAQSQKLLAQEIKNANDAAEKGGGGSSKAEDAFQRAIVTAQGRTRQLQEEARLSGLAGSELEAMRLQIDLETQAKKRGLEVSAEMSASIMREVEARRQASQAVAGAKLDADIAFERDQLGRSSNEQRIASRLRSSGLGLDSDRADAMRLNDTLRETRDLLSGAASGFLADMRSGKTAAEALTNQVNKMVDKLLDAAMNQAITGLFGGGSGGSLGWIGKAFGIGGGGSSFTPHFAANGAELFGPGFAGGGWTGSGGKYDPAGIVHRGEFVFDAMATNRIGVGVLEGMRRGLPGYASGGTVAMPTYVPPPANGNAASKVNVQVVNRTTGEVEGSASTRQNPDGSIDVLVDLVEARMAGRMVRGQGSMNAAVKAVGDNRQLWG